MSGYLNKAETLGIISMLYESDPEHNKILDKVHEAIVAIPAADIPPSLWTDEQIVGTEMLTHTQENQGFEIHFRTDSNEKYEAVQNECRKQRGHAKPAADVRPVKQGKWVDTDNYYQRWKCSVCGCHTRDAEPPYCPNCGARMEVTE